MHRADIDYRFDGVNYLRGSEIPDEVVKKHKPNRVTKLSKKEAEEATLLEPLEVGQQEEGGGETTPATETATATTEGGTEETHEPQRYQPYEDGYYALERDEADGWWNVFSPADEKLNSKLLREEQAKQTVDGFEEERQQPGEEGTPE